MGIYSESYSPNVVFTVPALRNNWVPTCYYEAILTQCKQAKLMDLHFHQTIKSSNYILLIENNCFKLFLLSNWCMYLTSSSLLCCNTISQLQHLYSWQRVVLPMMKISLTVSVIDVTICRCRQSIKELWLKMKEYLFHFLGLRAEVHVKDGSKQG